MPDSLCTMFFMPAPSQECGVLSSLLFLCAEGDPGRPEIPGKTGIWGEGAAAGLHWGAGKGGEVQSRLAHTSFLLALLVHSQTRRGTCLNNTRWVQEGETPNQRGAQKGRDANSPSLDVGGGAAGTAHAPRAAGRARWE